MNLRQLAQHLGLSETTVSRALNGYPEVSDDTRARVRLAAEMHGYQPNTRAKGLATGRAMAIGHVIPVATQHEIVNPVFADFIAGAGETYARHGYDMLLSVVADRDEADAYRNLQARRAVDGVILHGPRIRDPRIALLDEIGLPFAVHGRASDHDAPYCWLDVNNQSAFRQATDLLLDLGHRRIGLVNGMETVDFARRRRTGFAEALAAKGLQPDPSLMQTGEMTESYGYISATDMLRQDNGPTAFLVSSMICALGVRRAIEDGGRVMGQDISVVIFDDALSYLQNSGTPPIFTAMQSSVRDAGRLLAEMLIDRIAHPAAPPRTMRLEAACVIGRSTGPAPDRALKRIR